MKRPRPTQRQDQGQVTIMIALMMATFILFLAFVVNTGMLVHAKINLQNAADLAAYAGASAQARILNNISYLNYEMRRQYKKFLFRYYVIGNMAQQDFPGTGEARRWCPDKDCNNEYGVPAVCIIYNKKDNFCKNGSIVLVNKGMIEGLTTSIDLMMKQLGANFDLMGGVAAKNCKTIEKANYDLLNLWLNNSDPELTNLTEEIQSSNDAELKLTYENIKGLTTGLGLIPTEMLLSQRITTLEDYLNTEAQIEMTAEKIEALASEKDIAPYERTIQAYYTAYNTLGYHLFPGTDETLVLDELTPPTLAVIQKIKTGFETYYVGFPGNTGELDPDNPNCVGYPMSVKVPSLPVGAYKDPSYLTYYAIRLRAEAQLLFSPFGNLTLKAYAAAQPFGSRIGPVLDTNQFVRAESIPLDQEFYCMSSTCLGVPNLPLSESDSSASGWNNPEVLQQMLGQYIGEGGSTSEYIGLEDLERAYQAAMAPNPWEMGKYNMINELGTSAKDLAHVDSGDPFVKYFDSSLLHALWAPIVSPIDTGSDVEEALLGMIGEAFTASGDLQTAILDQMQVYLGKLRSGAGVHGEGYNVAKLEDPFHKRPDADEEATLIGLPSNLMIKSRDDVADSWNGVRNSEYTGEGRGRVGYSVKLVSFRTLREKDTTTDGSTSWSNDLELDAEANGDIEFLMH